MSTWTASFIAVRILHGRMYVVDPIEEENKKVLEDCLLFFSSYVLVIRNPFKILKSYPIYLKYQKILF